MTIVRRVLVVVIGALPVLPLALFAGYGVIIGFEMMMEYPAGGFLLLAWGLAGLYGAISLWLAAFDVRHIVVVIGLLTGCIAVSPIAYWIPRSSGWETISIHSLVIFGPLATACVLVFSTGYRIYTESPDRRTTSARFFFTLCMLAIAASILSIVLIGMR